VIDHEVRDGENSVEMGDLQKNIQGRELGVKGKGKIERRVASNTTIRGKHPRKKGTK
jgi:lactate dehydrogenase-like 2-hydroxyacid dehydrogenase